MSGFCDCDKACMLTSAERYRGRVRCRYKHGQVKPLGYFLGPKALAEHEANKAKRSSGGVVG
jgi:hypothetical protein